jgi:hypothetical protein
MIQARGSKTLGTHYKRKKKEKKEKKKESGKFDLHKGWSRLILPSTLL